MPAPANTVAPAVTGTTTAGSTLSCSTGTWTGSPDGYRFQWRRNGGAILGATASSFVVRVADQGQSVSCEVTAFNDSGSVAVASNAVSITRPTSSAFAEADPVAEADLATHAALKSGTHGIPALTGGDAGKGLLWDGAGWTAPDMATQAELDAAIGRSAVIQTSVGRIDSGAAQIYVGAQASWVTPASATAGLAVVYLDPADWNLTGHTTKMRLALAITPNATAPALDFTASLWSIASTGGAASNVALTLNSKVTGSDVTVASAAVAATGPPARNSVDFTPPAAGFYVVRLDLSAAMVSPASVTPRATLRWVSTTP